MILLLTTASEIRLVTDAAVTVDVHTSYIDYSGGTSTPGVLNTAISTAATTDIVASPASSTTRNVKTIQIRNKHATLPVVVTVLHYDGTTTVELFEAWLLAGQQACYMDDVGWQVFDSAGSIKPSAAPTVIVVRLPADQSNSTTTLTEVTGLTIPCGIGTWIFNYYLIYQAAVSTTGVRFSVNHDGTVTSFVYHRRFVSALSTASDANPDQDVVTAAAGLMNAFAARAKTTLGTGTTLGTDTGAADMLEIIEGICVVTVAGNLELWHGSEVAAASTVKAGASLLLIQMSAV